LYNTVEAVQFGQDRGRIVFGPKALAASRARIDELWIYPTAPLHHYEPQLQEKLSKRWDIPVTLGEPSYGRQEWAAKESSDSLCRQFGLLPAGGGPVPQRDSCRAGQDIGQDFEAFMRPVPPGLRGAGAPRSMV
jgi:hypothetical protein